MIQIKTPRQLFAVLLFSAALLTPFFAQKGLAYDVDARFLEQNAMIFPVGRLLPPGALNSAADLQFRDFQPIFELRVDEDNNRDDDPDRVVFLIRLEVAGGDPIFTVSSTPFDIRNDQQFRLNRFYSNSQLALFQNLHIGAGDDINANAVLPFIDGGNMQEGLYVLTVLLAPGDATTDDWGRYVSGENFGISSATMRAFNPSQVTLTQPQDGSSIQSAYPVFSWRFPRNEDVEFHFELVTGDPDADGTTVIDARNEENTYLNKVIPAGRGRGELTTYSYTGTGQERPLDIGRTYFWRVTAQAPTMFLDAYQGIPGQVFKFTYGYTMPQGIVLDEPSDGSVLEVPPTFRWNFPPLPDLRFLLQVFQGNEAQGEAFFETTIQAGQFGGERRTYRYGTGGNELDLQSGVHAWKVTAYATIDGREQSVESTPFTFTYSPTVTLIGMGPGDGEEIRRETPLFSWTISNNFQTSGFAVNVVGAPIPRAEEINGSMATGDEGVPGWAFNINKDVDGNLRQAMLDGALPRGYVFYWSVWARGQNDDWAYKSEPIRFTYPLPPQPDLSLIELTEPLDNGTVNTATPTLRWTAPNIPQFFQNMVSYAVEVLDENGAAFGNVADLRHNARDWRYQGQSLELGTTYIWKVTATLAIPNFELITVASASHRFTYSRWPSENDIALRSPENSGIVYTDRPTFEWRFPQGWDVSFTLLISDAAGADFSREIEINNANNRSYRYQGEALTPREYTWSVIAHVTVGRETRDFAPAMYNFTYSEQVDQAPGITLNEPAANAVVETNPIFTWSMSELPQNVSHSFVIEVRPVDENVTGGGLFEAPGDRREYTYDGEQLARGAVYTWNVRVVIDRDPVDLIGTSETRRFTWSPPERQQDAGASAAERVLAALNALPDNVLASQLRQALARALQGSNVETLRYNGQEITIEQLLQIIQQMEQVNMIQG